MFPKDDTRESLLQGTLDLLVLGVLTRGAQHGHGVVLAIQERSSDTLLVDHGSLYPALQRMEQRGMDPGVVGQVGEQSASALLHADGSGAEAAGR